MSAVLEHDFEGIKSEAVMLGGGEEQFGSGNGNGPGQGYRPALLELQLLHEQETWISGRGTASFPCPAWGT